MTPDLRTSRIGALAALAAFLQWGAFSLYFKALAHVPAGEVLAFRIVGSMVVAGLLLLRGSAWIEALEFLRSWQRLKPLVGSAIFITINWLAYIWAVGNGRALEASLGYFMFPLVSVLLGFFFLRERMNSRQWGAVALVSFGVVWLVLRGQGVPWVALTLALSFGIYGLLRKTTVVQSVVGLFLECLILSPFVLAYLAWEGGGAIATADATTLLLLGLAGPVTAVPLILFAYGARRLRLGTLGLMMYVNPTLQFLIAVYVFGEAFTMTHKVAFAAIWAGLALYSLNPAWLRRKTNQIS